MKIVYIAGPYRGISEHAVRMNIRRAEEEALFVWSEGGAAMCPHKNTAGFGGAYGIPDETWLAGDLELLARCDAIYPIQEWMYSSGAKVEVQFAREHGIKILYGRDDVRKYLRENKR
jgi:hypothetical protein